MNMKFFINEKHGGNIYSFSEESGIDVRDVIDFSASINPLGPPFSVLDAIIESIPLLKNYPDPDARELVHALAEHHGLPSSLILCGNGCTELIYLTLRAFRPRRLLITAPTFSEYERAWGISLGRRMASLRRVVLMDDDGFALDPERFIEAMKGCDMAFLCNPNNPTGRVTRREDLLEIAEAARRLECYLVVDEAFMDFCPGESVMPFVPENPYLIVLRSMTKFYALPGLRLGFGVFPEGVLPAVRDAKEPWTVNTLAIKAGVRALRDEDFRSRSIELMMDEKLFLEDGFRELNIKYTGSDVNFYLLKADDSEGLIRGLAEKGIIVRRCGNFFSLDDSYIRIAVKKRRENEILLEELACL
jgi:threonine-phosphate decarboxylase